VKYFYLRTGDARQPRAIDAVQYALSWTQCCYGICFPGTQGPASFQKKGNGTISSYDLRGEMPVYVNDMSSPTLEVPGWKG